MANRGAIPLLIAGSVGVITGTAIDRHDDADLLGIYIYKPLFDGTDKIQAHASLSDANTATDQATPDRSGPTEAASALEPSTTSSNLTKSDQTKSLATKQ